MHCVNANAPSPIPGNTKSDRRIASICFSTATAALDSGTRCSRLAFILDAGMVQTLSAKSISLQRAPTTSPRRPAVRIRNSKARALMFCRASKFGHERTDLCERQSEVVFDRLHLALAREQMV